MEFEYEAELDGFVYCVGCSPESRTKSGVFFYKCDLNDNFWGMAQPRRFVNLKTNLKHSVSMHFT